ncbi:NAD-dependent epimerase/dehydratase family protein [Frateuria aurantia]
MSPPTAMPRGRALVLGARGGIGSEITRQLLQAGWRVRVLCRSPSIAGTDASEIDWRQGDALRANDVLQAAQDCDVIVHAVNPPGYRRWQAQVLPMIDHTIAAARAVGATILLPGTVYNFGPETFPLVAEHAAQHPRTSFGSIRRELEDRLEAAAAQGVRSIVVRCGDFFGPQAGNNWFSQALIKPGRSVRTILSPGTPGIGHSWAYLPDVAATMMALLRVRAELPAHARFHMKGHWDPDGRHMTETIRRIAMQHGQTARVRRFPWWLLGLLAPFHETLRNTWRMRYLWRQPLQLDNQRLCQTLGQEPHTAWDLAVETSLRGQGCLPLASA